MDGRDQDGGKGRWGCRVLGGRTEREWEGDGDRWGREGEGRTGGGGREGEGGGVGARTTLGGPNPRLLCPHLAPPPGAPLPMACWETWSRGAQEARLRVPESPATPPCPEVWREL